MSNQDSRRTKSHGRRPHWFRNENMRYRNNHRAQDNGNINMQNFNEFFNVKRDRFFNNNSIFPEFNNNNNNNMKFGHYHENGSINLKDPIFHDRNLPMNRNYNTQADYDPHTNFSFKNFGQNENINEPINQNLETKNNSSINGNQCQPNKESEKIKLENKVPEQIIAKESLKTPKEVDPKKKDPTKKEPKKKRSKKKENILGSTETVKEIQVPLPSIKIKNEPESDKSNSYSSSEEEKKTKQKKNKSNEEVVYMGKPSNFENLIEETEHSNESKKECILCDIQGHTSFECFMQCKNCGENYHNLIMCPKPANLSIMLQNFMEFCMTQCTQYDPDRKFTFVRDNVNTELIPGFPHRTLKDNISASGSAHKKSHKRKRKYSSESDSSDSRNSSLTDKNAKKKRKSKNIGYPLPFYPMAASPFNPLAAAMMGLNPAAFMGKNE